MFFEIFALANAFVLVGSLVCLCFIIEFNNHKRKKAREEFYLKYCQLLDNLSIQVVTLQSDISYLRSLILNSKTLSFTDDMFTELEKKYLNDKGVL